MSDSYEAIAATLLHIAQEVAVPILKVYASDDFSVEFKGKDDPVTRADKLANEFIVHALGVAFPGVPVVAEESEEAAHGDYRQSPRAFFVDPIDGTKEFVAKTGAFCTMIGMIEHGRPVVGVVYCPATEKAYVGFPGGAFLTYQGVRTPLHVTAATSLAEAKAVVSRVHRSAEVDEQLTRLGLRTTEPVGSAGIKAMRVAEGKADLYVHPSYAGKRWDACAPEAIVRAAGGIYTDAHGDLFDYRAARLDNDRGVLAGPPALHAAAVRALGLAS